VSDTLRHFVTIATILEACNAIAAGTLRGIRKAEWTAIGAIGFIAVTTPL
jgi:hypothetical protein